jgi:HSP20 family protein
MQKTSTGQAVMKKSFLFRDEKEESVSKKLLCPAVNVFNCDQEYIMVVATPGFHKNDFAIVLEKNKITISASRETDPGVSRHDRWEFDYHSWSRSFIMPDDADGLMTRAVYKAGELIITIPKGINEMREGVHTIYVY